MVKKPDVLVIGGGMIGAALTWQLARRGLRVVMLSKHGLAGGASGANLGMVLLADCKPGFSFELALAGFREFGHLDEELGWDLEYENCPVLALIRNQAECQEAGEILGNLQRVNFPVALLTPAEVKEQAPSLDVAKIQGALYMEQGRVNPLQLVAGYCRRAAEQGANLGMDYEVLGFKVTAGRVTEVETDHGVFQPGMVVLAAGAWTRSLGLLLSLDIPQFYIHGEALVTAPVPGFLRHTIITVHSERASLEEEATRRALGGGGWDKIDGLKAVETAVNPTARGNLILGQVSTVDPAFRQTVNAGSIQLIIKGVQGYLPALNRLTCLRSWIAPVPFTYDHEPFVGPVPAIDNLYLASGFKSTLVVTPIITRLLAELIVDGATSPSLEPYYLERWGGFQVADS
ncbi:FAD-binding oxidoreductase [Moorella naiadis]|uniref:NAD(P)/FAD-dependent oxidoreductase n=1 Tax=Moorella naiadis (nom. illeg.) TaxID=3093670 RepID=UPI003D9CA581